MINLKYKLIKTTYKSFLKRIFFLFDPEFIHDCVTFIGNILGKVWLTRFFVKKIFKFESKRLEQNVFNLNFQNPIGLSAGFDKDAKLINILGSVGFGYAELGSVTYKPYEGNKKPRLYRLKKSQALSVYYGLKNDGVEEFIEKVKKRKDKSIVLNISIAKTNSLETAEDEAGILDYYNCMKRLVEEDIGDMYTINISCPNTFGGEPFTTPEKLQRLLHKLADIQTGKPIFIKMPINLDWREFKDLLKVCVEYRVNGVTIGNLTKVRDPDLIKDDIPENVKGGISGRPTWDLSNNLIRSTYREYGDRLKIIGVGGIFSAEDAYTKIKLGASLVELITGMIYEGPQLIGQINAGLVKLLENDGYKNIEEAIGADVVASSS